MTTEDRMEILRRAAAQHGQSRVAKRIKRSPGAISQILSGTYNQSGNGADLILELVEAEFGSSTVDCPELGEIPLCTCVEERDKPFKATSSQRVRLYRACQTCPNRYPNGGDRGSK